MKITFLGTGTSHGVPSIDCMIQAHARCPQGVCAASETDPKHRRTRCSILITHGDRTILVDVSPDFRQQALHGGLLRIDAALITHRHADHIAGIPDIRSHTRLLDRPLDVYGSAESMDAIRRGFEYIFDPATVVGGGIPRLALHPIDGPVTLFGLKVSPVPVAHGSLAGCFGYRFGRTAYVPDVKELPASSLDLLRGLDLCIFNCLRPGREHPTHLTLEQSVALMRKIRPERCLFVHMAHDIHYINDAAALDPWMDFAYDGLTVEAE